MKTFTIMKIANQYNRSRVAVQNWIEQGKFPNARKVISPAGEYWEVPFDDLINFTPPKRGRRKSKDS